MLCYAMMLWAQEEEAAAANERLSTGANEQLMKWKGRAAAKVSTRRQSILQYMERVELQEEARRVAQHGIT